MVAAVSSSQRHPLEGGAEGVSSEVTVRTLPVVPRLISPDNAVFSLLVSCSASQIPHFDRRSRPVELKMAAQQQAQTSELMPPTSAEKLGLRTIGFQIWGALLSGFRTHLLSLHCHAHHLPCTDMCCAEELVGPWFPVSAIGCCIMSCKALRYDLGTEAVWEKLYTCLIEPRCGPPPRPPSSWRALCRRRFLRSVHVQISVHCDKTLHPEINLDQPWDDARTFENRRVSTDLTARAGVPPVDAAECPWKSSALIFEWILERSRFDKLHQEIWVDTEAHESHAYVNQLAGAGTWEEMQELGNKAFHLQARLAAIALEDTLFADLKPSLGQSSCSVIIEPAEGSEGDLTIRHVINFEASIQQNDEATDFNVDDNFQKRLTCNAADADPILALRRGKDNNIKKNRFNIGGIPPKAFAIGRGD